jgi:hypothetical protein
MRPLFLSQKTNALQESDNFIAHHCRFVMIRVHLHTLILLRGCMVVWMWSTVVWRLACFGSALSWLWLGLKSGEDLCHSPNMRKCTVTRTTQNEALLWKITNLRIERAPCWCWNILSLAHTGIWHSSMQEMSSSSRSRTFCSADEEKFRKNLKIKMTGKTAGVSPHGEGRSRT